MIRLLLTGLCCAFTLLGSEAAVRGVVRDYVDARERRDAKALGALVLPDADQLVSSGEWRRGTEQLVAGMLSSSERNSGKRVIVIETVRFLTPEVAIADGRYEIAGASDTRRMWTTFVVQRSGGAWRIAAIRNMLPSAPSK